MNSEITEQILAKIDKLIDLNQSLKNENEKLTTEVVTLKSTAELKNVEIEKLQQQLSKKDNTLTTIANKLDKVNFN